MNNRLILFDGTCGLCHGWVRFVIRFDTQSIFRFASIQSETGQSIMKKHHLATDKIETLIYIEQGNVYLKSQACLMVIRHLTFPVKLLSVFIVVPRFIRDWFYSQIARSRYQWFGRRDECLLTEGDYRDRFI